MYLFFKHIVKFKLMLIVLSVLILIIDLSLKVMAISESSRLHASLKKENVPVERLIVNQILPPASSDCKFCAMRRKV